MKDWCVLKRAAACGAPRSARIRLRRASGTFRHICAESLALKYMLEEWVRTVLDPIPRLSWLLALQVAAPGNIIWDSDVPRNAFVARAHSAACEVQSATRSRPASLLPSAGSSILTTEHRKRVRDSYVRDRR